MTVRHRSTVYPWAIGARCTCTTSPASMRLADAGPCAMAERHPEATGLSARRPPLRLPDRPGDAGGKARRPRYACPCRARVEVETAEAAIVREIFGAYAHGRSMKAIAQDLNQRRIPFPAKDTSRGPARLGWAVSTVRVILRNEKYAGVWVWNKTRFLKDPDSGRHRPVRRPADE
jgi:hypothetical protein